MARPVIAVRRVPGLAEYDAMLARQTETQRAVARGDAPNTLFLLEHAPIITLGRDADEANLLAPPAALEAAGIAVRKTTRGGDVTYHGPGQMVAYPILDLRQWRLSVGWYLRQLEAALIVTIGSYGLAGARVEGLTGVWVDGAKAAAVGVGLRDWVTSHGVALNVDPDMTHFGRIVPCGIADKPVTSLRALLGAAPPMSEVMTRFEEAFFDVFDAARPGD